MRMVNFRCLFIKKKPTNLCTSHTGPSIKDTQSRTMFGESLGVMWGIIRRKKTSKNLKHSFSYVFGTVGSKSIYFLNCSTKSHTHKGINYSKQKFCFPIFANLSLIRKQRGECSWRENKSSPNRKGTRQLPFPQLRAQLSSAQYSARARTKKPTGRTRRPLTFSLGLLLSKVGI